MKTIQSIKLSNFNTILDNDPNTFCGKYFNYLKTTTKYCILNNLFSDLIGVCIKVSDIEVCGNSTKYIETPKREIILMDISMKTVSYFYNFIKFFNNLYFYILCSLLNFSDKFRKPEHNPEI